MTDLPLHVVSETAATVTLGWTPPAGAAGYVFYRDGVRSSTLDGSRSSVKFAKGATSYRVRALGVVAEGEYPTVAPPPPAGVFGASLYEGGFEYAAKQIVGTTVTPTTNQELHQALGSGHEIIDVRRLALAPGQLVLPPHSEFRMLINANTTGARVYRQGGDWRLKDSSIGLGAPEDCVKAENTGRLHIDGCDIFQAPKQGILLYADYTVVSNSRVRDNGTIDASNQHHGLYASRVRRLLLFNDEFFGNVAYQVQLYPSAQYVRGANCLAYGGKTRGGVVVGSSSTTQNDPTVTADVHLIGWIAAKAPWYGFDQWQQAYRIKIEDCLGWENVRGDYAPPLVASAIRPKHGDPKFKNAAAGDFTLGADSAAKGIVDKSLWKYMPPTDIHGRTRTTADAGARAA